MCVYIIKRIGRPRDQWPAHAQMLERVECLNTLRSPRTSSSLLLVFMKWAKSRLLSTSRWRKSLSSSSTLCPFAFSNVTWGSGIFDGSVDALRIRICVDSKKGVVSRMWDVPNINCVYWEKRERSVRTYCGDKREILWSLIEKMLYTMALCGPKLF